ncbi:MAG: diaminopropionate ammonia-lyase [Candidatus Zixiibacteriota bacterium]
MRLIKAVSNRHARIGIGRDTIPPAFSVAAAEDVIGFHSTIPQYYPTPLLRLPAAASKMKIAEILIKDESKRFGLNSFKVLGGTYSIMKYICTEIGIPDDRISFQDLQSGSVRGKTGDITFSTATDGNHGLGVAWTAQQLGYKAVVFMPVGTVPARIRAIEETGAEVQVTKANYDETVNIAAEAASKKGWVSIQDTTFEGYETIPEWVMQGYLTIMYETLVQMKTMGRTRPTHILLQAGVGSMAAAVLGYLVSKYVDSYPYTAIVEPVQAACFYDSFVVGDGEPYPAKGDLRTIMAGLSCGEPNTLAWDIINNFADAAIACEDEVSVEGMRLLANPTGNDPKIISGESGAVTAGLLWLLTRDNQYTDIRQMMDIGPDSVVLLINTEGATDPDNYRKIIQGYY